jgi:hypothetical protein
VSRAGHGRLAGRHLQREAPSEEVGTPRRARAGYDGMVIFGGARRLPEFRRRLQTRREGARFGRLRHLRRSRLHGAFLRLLPVGMAGSVGLYVVDVECQHISRALGTVVLCSWAEHLPVVMHGVIERGG